jgi:hypothetical protein
MIHTYVLMGDPNNFNIYCRNSVCVVSLYFTPNSKSTAVGLTYCT